MADIIRRGDDGAPLIILLHGRGADAGDMAGLAAILPEAWGVVAPNAPFPAEPWGYGRGYAWYRFLGDRAPEPDSFSTSLGAVAELLAFLPPRLGREPGPIALGGFSQGGTVATAYALAASAGELPDAVTIPLAVNLSGFLAEHPRVRPHTAAGTRFFWAHGTEDPAIPFAWAVAGRQALRAAGADLVERDYPMGHGIVQEELHDLVAWIEGDATA